MTILLLINDSPYGTEKAYNALRLGMTLLKEHPDVEVRVFLMADAVGCVLPKQNTPQGYYNIERMLKFIQDTQEKEWKKFQRMSGEFL